MITFKTISYFRKRLSSMMKVKKGVYVNVEKELINEFKGKPIDQIRINNDMILIEGDMVVIKLRLPDKKQHLAKKDGYRLIYLVSKVVPVVAFLDIYPKNGPLQQLDEDEKVVLKLVNDFISEGEQGLLQDWSAIL